MSHPEDSDVEDAKDYKRGGYHTVAIGDTLGKYTVVRKLGWGHFSTVWLCKGEKSHVALKVMKSAKKYTETAKDELKLLKKVSQTAANFEVNVVCLVDDFRHFGPNGTHICIAMEVLGHNLLKLIRKFPKGVSSSIVRRIASQVLSGLAFLHDECEIIHTDLKPENIMIVLPPKNMDALINGVVMPMEDYSDIRVKIADLGNACWTFKHFTEDIQTRQYRSPEVLLGASYNVSTDIWSLGCILFELLTGDYLFDPHSSDEYTRDEDHMAQILELLGKVPNHKIHGKYARDIFTRKGELRNIEELNYWPLHRVLEEKYNFREKSAQQTAEFLLTLLDFDWKKRIRAADALKLEWLNK